jgi:hypothetical protein
MNIKIVYADRIDSWDTRADGSASTSHAVLRVNGRNLELWSKLRFDEDYNPEDGVAKKQRQESGKAESILRIDVTDAPQDLIGWCAVAHDKLGLLRLDVDGETFYKFEEPDEDDEAIYEYGGQDDMGNVFDVSDTATYDHMHPTTAALKAAVNRYPQTK